MPSGTPGEILRQFTPLELYLERELDVDIRLESAPDFATFMRRLLANDYDLASLAPHLALLAMRRGHWVPLVSVDYGVRPTLICRKGDSIATLQDLRGRRVAVPDSLALITLQGESELARAGLIPGKTVEIVYAPNHVSVMELVLRGLADVGFVSSVLLESQPPDRRERLAVIAQLPGAFSFAYLASDRLPAHQRAHLQELLVRFPGTPEGRQFFSPGRTVPMRPLSGTELEPFGSFLPVVESRLAEGGQ